jgi:hypothetical protein
MEWIDFTVLGIVVKKGDDGMPTARFWYRFLMNLIDSVCSEVNGGAGAVSSILVVSCYGAMVL